jgi:hypothetical protein
MMDDKLLLKGVFLPIDSLGGAWDGLMDCATAFISASM